MIVTMKDMSKMDVLMVLAIMKISIGIIRESGKMIKEMELVKSRSRINLKNMLGPLLMISIMAEGSSLPSNMYTKANLKMGCLMVMEK